MQSVLRGHDYFILEDNGVELRLRDTAASARNLFNFNLDETISETHIFHLFPVIYSQNVVFILQH